MNFYFGKVSMTTFKSEKMIDLIMDKKIPSYINEKGKEVELSISRHAVNQFIKRWSKIFPDKLLLNNEAESKIIEWFSHCNKIKNLSRQEKTRLNRYGKDTLFFRNNAFTFIVQNAAIVTIELSDKNKRNLNK